MAASQLLWKIDTQRLISLKPEVLRGSKFLSALYWEFVYVLLLTYADICNNEDCWLLYRKKLSREETFAVSYG